MKIGGLQKTSLIDYPGKIAAVVFTQGCDLRCPYCHNPELVLPKHYQEPIPEETFFQFLEKRKKHLDGVVITGGEPTLHADLEAFIERIRSYGFCIKLDTNGTHPQVLQHLLSMRLVDYVAMDIKGPLKTYSLIAGVRLDLEAIRSSIRIIKDSGIGHEFRTTVVPGLHTISELKEIGSLIHGAHRYALQAFEGTHTLRPDLLNRAAFDRAAVEGLRAYFEKRVDCFEIRGYAEEHAPEVPAVSS